MSNKIANFVNSFLKNDSVDIRPGDVIRVHQKIKEKKRERIQIFEGIVLAKKHGSGVNATITVRKVISGIGVEKIFPIHSPNIAKIEVIKRSKVRRAKLYFLREAKGRKARLKKKGFEGFVFEEKPKEVEKTEEIVENEEVTEKETAEPVEEKKEESAPEKKKEE